MSKTRYSAFKVLKEALTGHKGWEPTWRDAEPKTDGYDVIIVGGGGHGLATAYYLAKNHGITNVAVLERGWIGSGNVGRNTTIIRSNYLLPGNEPFYELSMQLWENLEQDLNYNAMVSQRGIMNFIHSDAQRDAFIRRGNAMLFADAGCEYLEAKEVIALFSRLTLHHQAALLRLISRNLVINIDGEAHMGYDFDYEVVGAMIRASESSN